MINCDFFLSSSRETMNLSSDADSRTDTIFERWRDISPFFRFIFLFLRGYMPFLKKKNEKNHATTQILCRSYYPHWLRYSLSPVCRIFSSFSLHSLSLFYRFHRYFLLFTIFFYLFARGKKLIF